LPVFAEPPGVWIWDITVGWRSFRLSSQRNDWGFAAGVNVEETGDDGNFWEKKMFVFLRKYIKNKYLLMVMVFDENL